MGLPERKARSNESDAYLSHLYLEAGKPNGITLVAVGGYGRGELSPGSDLDLLILHDGSFGQFVRVR
jgi:[protein-PII] uridylyltransferase